MSRHIVSVHVDIARFLVEIQDVQSSGGDAALGPWIRNLARSLALNDGTISTYGAILLDDARKYRDGEKERKRANKEKEGADSDGKTRNVADSSIRKKERKKESQEKTIPDKRERDLIFDEVVNLFFPEGVPVSGGSRIGKIVRDLKSISATPEQIRTRTESMRRTDWGKSAGPEGLIKQWSNLVERVSQLNLKTGTIPGSYPLDQEQY